MWRLGYAFFAWLSLFAFASTSVFAKDKVDDILGYYSTPSRRCVEYNGKKFVSCESRFRDCLLVKKLKDVAMVEVFSVQANQHLCATQGFLENRGGRLVVSSSDLTDGVGGNPGFEIVVSKNLLRLRYLSEPSGVAAYCGAHATLEGLQFNRASKEAGLSSGCFKE